MAILSSRPGDKSPVHQIAIDAGYESVVSQAGPGRAAVELNHQASAAFDQGVVAQQLKELEDKMVEL